MYIYARSGPTLHPYYPTESAFRALLESTSGLLVGLLMPMIVYGIVYCLRYKKRESFLFYAFTITTTLSLLLIGNVLRWRLPMMPFVLMFAAVGSIVYFRKIKGLYPLYISLYAILIGLNASRGAIIRPLAISAFVFLLIFFIRRLFIQRRLFT